MGCQYGTEKKYQGDNTIVVDPYVGVNAVAETFMRLAFIPQPFVFDADEICGSEPLDYIQIEIADFIVGAALYGKVEQNARREAWFKGCQCKAAPVPPTPPPPPELPPEATPLPPFIEVCDTSEGVNHWRLEYRTYSGDSYNAPNLRIQIYPYFNYQDVSVRRSETNPLQIEVLNYGSVIDTFPRPNTDYSCVDWRLIYCQVEPPPPPPEEGEKPQPPDPCDKSCNCRFDDTDLLKQPDKAEVISVLKLWISESNNRIRDEILQNLSNAINASRVITSNDIDLAISYINQRYGETISRIDRSDADTESLVNGARRDIIGNTDGAKNQVLAAIGASTTAIGAGIVAATTTITGAITASTTTITGAITTATTTINNAINGAKDSIESTIKSEVEKYTPRYRKLTLTFTQAPQGVSLTYGLRDAPNKYALGWIQFYRQGSGNNRYYYDRQFVINLSQEFICQDPNVDAGYVLHILPNYQVNATLSWTSKKE